MAAIDKIYLNSYKEYIKFKNWCENQPPLTDKYGTKVKISTYLINEWTEDSFSSSRSVFSAPYYVDAYVIRNCPFDFIQKELMINYGHWSQEHIKEYYENVKNWSGEGECPYWAKLEDFVTLEDGTMTIKGLEKSDYEKIKDGELYTSPKVDYKYGKHFKCIKHPSSKFNTPFKCKKYSVEIDTPNGYMWYTKKYNSWDFVEEFIEADWISSHAYIGTIRALKRMMLKWKLPIGAIVTATGRYTFDTYQFKIVK